MADTRNIDSGIIRYTPTQQPYYNIPKTIDVQQKLIENPKDKKTTVWVVSLVYLGVVGFLIYQFIKTWWVAVPMYLLMIWVLTLIIRFVFYKETEVSDTFEYLQTTDYKLETEVFWEIYNINERYPYVSSYVNGSRAIFVRFYKDITIGKPSTAIYKHFKGLESLKRDLNVLDLSVVHLDTMVKASSGVDLTATYEYISESDVPAIQELMEEVVAYSELIMSRSSMVGDVWVIHTRGKVSQLDLAIKKIEEKIGSTNYYGFSILDRGEIQDLCKQVFNLEHFSINEATQNALKKMSEQFVSVVRKFDSEQQSWVDYKDFTFNKVEEKVDKKSKKQVGHQKEITAKNRKKVHRGGLVSKFPEENFEGENVSKNTPIPSTSILMEQRENRVDLFEENDNEIGKTTFVEQTPSHTSPNDSSVGHFNQEQEGVGHFRQEHGSVSHFNQEQREVEKVIDPLREEYQSNEDLFKE